MTANKTQLAQSLSSFVVFEIVGGCECCKPGPRETLLPAGWAQRGGRLTLRQVLAFPHNVREGAILILAQRSADGMTREDFDAVRSGVEVRYGLRALAEVTI